MAKPMVTTAAAPRMQMRTTTESLNDALISVVGVVNGRTDSDGGRDSWFSNLRRTDLGQVPKSSIGRKTG